MASILVGNIFGSDTHYEQILDSQKHRGWDLHGYVKYGNNVYFGGSRHKNFANDSSVTYPHDGGTENFKLVFEGEYFKTTPTYECMLAYVSQGVDYRMYQEDCSFVVLDESNVSLMFGRANGPSTLYLYNENGRFALVSELKVLKNFFNIEPSKTLYLEPFVTYFLDLETFTLTSERTYMYAEFTTQKKSNEELQGDLREIITAGVANKMNTTKNLCVGLSGGVDSSVLTAIAASINHNITAFVVSAKKNGAKASKTDDVYFARKVADYLKINLIEVYIPEEYFLDKSNILHAIEVSETYQKNFVALTILQLRVAEEMRKNGFDVELSGEGADSSFGSMPLLRAFFYKDEDWLARRRHDILNYKDHWTSPYVKASFYSGGVQFWSPFFNTGFVNYCLSELGPQYKWRGGIAKPAFRDAFKGMLPDDVIYRPKKMYQLAGGAQDLTLSHIKLEEENHFYDEYISIFGSLPYEPRRKSYVKAVK